MEIILVDNGSTDSSLKWVKQHFPDISVVELGTNYFFSGGNNRAIDHCNNEYLIFLNNDVKVEPMWLDALNSVFCQNPKANSFNPKFYPQRIPHFEYAGAGGGFMIYGYPYCRGRIFDIVEEDTGQYDTDAT